MTTLSMREIPSDPTKLLAEWALVAGRSLQSKQTGYVHLYEGEGAGAVTIPVLENALFALALLRSRSVEQIQEARGIIKGILGFQIQREGIDLGNFPRYLHEYPVCNDSCSALRLLASFYWMLRQFGAVLGGALRGELKKAARLSVEQALLLSKMHPLPYSLSVRLASAQRAYGILFEEEAWVEKGSEAVARFASRQLEEWHTTSHLSDLLVGLQMGNSSFLGGEWEPLWSYMERSWHREAGCYIGPCFRERQDGVEPQPNLYDLYAGCFSGAFPDRLFPSRPYHLQGILVQPASERFASLPEGGAAGRIRQRPWQFIYAKNWAYTLIGNSETGLPWIDKMAAPFRLIWGDRRRVHTFLIQGGSYQRVEGGAVDSSEAGIRSASPCSIESGEEVTANREHTFRLFFDLGPLAADEGGEPRRELEFFIDFHPDLVFAVEGVRATTFELGQEVSFSLDGLRVRLAVFLSEGEGTFVGHIMRGNRAAQADLYPNKRFQAHDWTLFVRTVRRGDACRLEARISFAYTHPS